MAKRSLHIGINDYPGTNQDLRGCVNDAKDWQQALGQRGFGDQALLLNQQATKANIVAALEKIVGATGSEDLAIITYSGHGTWIPDTNGDEPDGRDEAWCAHDAGKGNLVTDDELYDIVAERERGARIVLLSDSCHSGSVSRFAGWLDDEKDEGKRTIRFLAPEHHLTEKQKRTAVHFQQAPVRSRVKNAALCISGCRDHEFSYDATFRGRPNGAFTFVALRALQQLPETANYQDWWRLIRRQLPSVSYPQTPILSGSYYQRTKWKILDD